MKKKSLDKLKSKKVSIIKFAKKSVYRFRAKDFYKITALMAAGGIFASICYTVKYQYIEYAVSKAHVSLVYPEIADGMYPDGSRFTYYDLISKDRVQETLDIMQSRGKYQYFTADQLCEQFYVYSNLEESVKNNVSAIRSAGNDYSYVANEYLITFVQPHDYGNPNFMKKIFTKNYSDEFLTELINVDKKYIQEHCGGSGGFTLMTDIDNIDSYDYAEKVSIYKTRISSIVSYLNTLNESSGGYTSPTTGKSLKDIINLYKILFSERLDQIENFVDVSGLTADREVITNKIDINIENNLLQYNKFNDAAQINSFAKNKYDHTFTENLIVVATSEDNGLYQARPKTAFDTVVDQFHSAYNNAVEYKAALTELNADRNIYNSQTYTEDEYTRLTEKCNAMQKSFDDDYNSLCETAKTTVADYLSAKNKNYITSKVERKEKINTKFLIKCMISFILGAMLVFIAYIAVTDLKDRNKLRKKIKLLNRIRENENNER